MINTPSEVFEEAIELLNADEKHSVARVLLNASAKHIEGSTFVNFLYTYLHSMMNKVWKRTDLACKDFIN